jgi:predicted kinase
VHPEIVLPDPCLIVLIGASGAGKSTFAARWFAASEILASDAFRARLGRGEDDQGATKRAFGALHAALDRRLSEGRLAVVDATNIQPAARRALSGRAMRAGLPVVAILFDLTLAECLAGDRARPGRRAGEAIVTRQWALLQRFVDADRPFAGEGFAAVHRLASRAAAEATPVRRESAR